MPLMSFSRGSLFDPQTISPGCVDEGTVPWLLASLGDSLVPNFLATEWRGSSRSGRNAWPAPVLMSLVLLRWAEGGGSRAGACRRAKTDLAWRAAMGLPAYGPTPTEKTMREFEHWLGQRSPSCDRPRYEVLFDWLLKLASGEVTERMWVMDGTPMFCFGALRGTVRLLGDGLRGLLRRVARARKTAVHRLAVQLGVPWTTAKSIKGGLNIDWRDQDARHAVVDRLARDVVRVVEHVLDHLGDLPVHHQRWVQRRCDSLLKVISDDLEANEDGRLVVARRRTSDRIVSITDPAARSGRKSENQPFKGFKLNVLGDLLSGLIVGVQVFPGHMGEGRPGVELLERATKLGLRLRRVLADSAFGGTPVRLAAAALGVTMVAPPPHIQDKGDAVQKHEFEIDFDAARATCPQGHAASERRSVVRSGQSCDEYRWPYEVCRDCPIRARCAPKVPTKRNARGRPPVRGKRLLLNANEQELRMARAQWNTVAMREEYRRRGEGESLIARMVRYGARQARAFGLASANLQAHAIAMAANLALMAKRLAATNSAPQHTTLPLFPDTT